MLDASNPDVFDCKGLTCAIGEIYAAAEDSAQWPAVLGRIAEMVEGDGACLVSNYVNTVARDVHAFAGTDPAMIAEFNAHYASRNVWAQRMDQMFPVGAVGYSDRAIPDRELHKTEFYAGLLKPYDVAYCLGAILEVPQQPPALLTILRSAQRGRFEERQGRVYELLLPHIRRALRLHCELAALRSAKCGLELALDVFDRAVFGLSGRSEMLFCNRRASELLQEGDGVSVRQKRLVADFPEQDAKLELMLRQAATSGAGFSGPGAQLIDRRSGKPALRLTLMPFAANFLSHVPGLATLVFIDDPMWKAIGRAEVLRTLFRLSPTEARIADLLAEGEDISRAAESLRMSSKTARFHLKSIFRKMEVKRQTDLVRIVLGLPGVQPPSQRV